MLKKTKQYKQGFGQRCPNQTLRYFYGENGYTARYRKQIADSTYKAQNILLKAFESGKKPLHRGKNWEKQERKELKLPDIEM